MHNTVFFAGIMKDLHKIAVMGAVKHILIPIGVYVFFFYSRKQTVQLFVKIFPVSSRSVTPLPKQIIPRTFASIHMFRMPTRFSSLSLINGKIGESHTTVGIPASRKVFSTSNRSAVVLTFGSIFLHKSSSYVVMVICTTHFVFSFIFCRRSKSRRIRLDFVITVKPNPYLSISCSAYLTFCNSVSNGMYGSVMEPVPIMHFFRL